MQEIINHLESGRALLDIGWCRHVLYHEKNGKKIAFCAIGTITEQVTGRRSTWFNDPSTAGARDYLHKALPKSANNKNGGHGLWRGAEKQGDIVMWNNDPKRTAQEVKDLFDKAICMAKCDARREVADKLELVDA